MNFAKPEGDAASNVEVTDDVSSETVRDILTLHKAMVHPAFEDEVGHMRLMVRRGMLLDDCFMKMSRAKADQLKLPVQVSFVGEPAVDEGGPSREFFGLVFQELAQSSLLTGCSGNQCFSSYTPFLQKNHYKLAGQLVSLSFLNGGPGPHLFCVAIAERITYGKRISPLKVEDVPDRQLKEHLIKTSNIDNENEFLNYVERNLDRRHDIGYSKPLKLTDKKELVDTLISDSIGMNGAGMYQFIEGLETCNLLTVLRKHPKKFTPFFCKPAKDLTAIEMLDLFLPVFSDVGSNRRRVEEEIIMTWSYFLNDVEDVKVCHVIEDEEYVLRLEDILQFATGCEVLPAGGFCGKPGIDFDHVSTDRKISVNTCAGVLHFPANESMRRLESMKEEFIFCILNGQGFGNV